MCVCVWVCVCVGSHVSHIQPDTYHLPQIKGLSGAALASLRSLIPLSHLQPIVYMFFPSPLCCDCSSGCLSHTSDTVSTAKNSKFDVVLNIV